MSRRAIYPGSFDPITNGHIDLISRASGIFDEVVVAVAEHTHKKTTFTTDERLGLVNEAVSGLKGVKAESFKGLVIDFARARKVNVLIRGVRMFSDFEYELQMALTNRRIDPKIETVFLMPSEEHSFLSSSLLKELVALGADVGSYVPDYVVEKLKQKLNVRD